MLCPGFKLKCDTNFFKPGWNWKFHPGPKFDPWRCSKSPRGEILPRVERVTTYRSFLIYRGNFTPVRNPTCDRPLKFTLKRTKTEKHIFSMKKWNTNKLRQPTSWLISWFISSLEWIFLEQKKVELFWYISSLVAWPFQTQYSSKSWHFLQEYLVVFFNHKSLVEAMQV